MNKFEQFSYGFVEAPYAGGSAGVLQRENNSIAELGRTLAELGVRRTIIEAGHVYADPKKSPLREDDHKLAQVGKGIAVQLKGALTIPATVWWFIDETHGDPQTIQTGLNGITTAASSDLVNGFRPEVVVRESDEQLGAEAIALADRIPPDRIFKIRKGISLEREGDESRYILYQRDHKKRPHSPTCCLLDAALYLRKWNAMDRAGVSITVLPDAYRPQQATTHRILKAAGIPVPIVNAYFDRGGQTSFERNF